MAPSSGLVMFRYTAMRLALFAGCLALFLLLQLPLLWAAVAAALVSMVASYFLQKRDRDLMAGRLQEKMENRLERREQRIDSERVEEDE